MTALGFGNAHVAGEIRASVKLLTIWGGFVTKPGLLSGVKAGADTYDEVIKLSKSPDPSLKKLGERLADEAETMFRQYRDAPPDAEVLFAQMVEKGLPDAQAIADANLNAEQVVDRMLNALTHREHLAPEMQALFRKVTEPVLAELLGNPAFFADIEPAAIAEILARQERQAARENKLIEELRHKIGRELKLTQTAVIQLARRVADQVPDFDAAFAELDRLVGAAEDLEKKGATPSNHPDFVDQVFAQAAALNAQAKFHDGVSAFDETLRREEEEYGARRSRLLEGAIEQAIVAGDASRASGFILERARMEDTPSLFQALRRVQDAWFLRGRDNGSRFDLEVSVHLAHQCIEMADSPAEELAAQNDLAIALRNMGERTSGPEGTNSLEGAINACHTSLSLATKADQPYQWAMIQQTLGNTLRVLGERIPGPEGSVLLGHAVDAFSASLSIRTEADYPLEWASCQLNLANARLRQGQRANPSDRASHLSESVRAYTASLRVFTESNFPNDWAMIQQNLAVALKAQSECSTPPGDLETLEKSVDASRNALRVVTEKDQPVRWATLMTNMAGVELQIADHERTADPRLHLKNAMAQITVALTVFDHDTSTNDFETAMRLRNDISARLNALNPKSS